MEKKRKLIFPTNNLAKGMLLQLQHPKLHNKKH